MLAFERLWAEGDDEAMFDTHALVLAGWSARDEALVRAHIEELGHLGVKPPSTFPLFYRVSASLVSQTDRLEVLGPDTSGEIEYVVVAMDDGLWVTVGSDQTDRKAETHGVALSKQLCGKVLGRTLWRLEEVRDHWDRLILRAHVVTGGERVLYQEGALAMMRPPDDLMQRYTGGGTLHRGTILMSGTLNAIGGIRPAQRFEMALEDPVRGRTICHAYDVTDLPVIA
jgi:2-keto-4-pentenoate hydratase/2-oxohepta-3-ene-1,7-dioic acid hydratase in catechol pathway